MSAGHIYTLSLRSTDSAFELTSGPRRACDRCRRRKTRCDGQRTCTTCSNAHVACCYDEVPQRKGRRCRNEQKRDPGEGQDGNPAGRRQRCNNDDTHFGRQGDADAASSLSAASNERPEALEYFSPSSWAGSPSDSTVDKASFNALGASDVLTHFLDTTNLSSSICSSSQASICIDELPMTATDGSAHGGDTILKSIPEVVSGPGLEPSLPRSTFLPYLQLFFNRLYAIFPVLNRHTFLETFVAQDVVGNTLDLNEHALLSALSATVIVQLNYSGSGTTTAQQSTLECWRDGVPWSHPVATPTYSADFFISQCLGARQRSNFVETANPNTILTSFFLFAYYGNMDRPRSAWYYLREAMNFALSLRLNESASYAGLDRDEAQRLRRLYWLLFITERAYALQHRSDVILRPCIELPEVFESENPRLIYGFVVLVHLYKSVDDEFVTAWKDQSSSPIIPSQNLHVPLQRNHWEHIGSSSPEDNDFTGLLQVQEMDETQRMDILVTRQWLRVLVWQIHVRHNDAVLHQRSVPRSGPEGRYKGSPNTLYPLGVSRDLLSIISISKRESLESHGIGMEQKIFDVACCLTDALSCSPSLGTENFSYGHNMLHSFMRLLVGFRNQESRYLQPLLSKATTILAAGMAVPTVLTLTAGNDTDPALESLLT